jgi:hypothetical protein
MAVFSLGWMDRDAVEPGKPDELARVTADAPDAPISSVLVNDDLEFPMVCDEISEQLIDGKAASPFSVAVALMGRNATVHEVLDDGTLRGWRRDYEHLEPGITTEP